MSDDRLLSVQDVYNAFAEHLNKLDELWPETDIHGPRKIHIVELLDAIKLRLVERARKNAERNDSPFEKAARKLTGTARDVTRPTSKPDSPPDTGKTAMQLAHEAAQARVRRPTS